MLLERYRRAHLPKTQFTTFNVDADRCAGPKCKRCVDTCPTYGIHWDEEKDLPCLVGYGGMEKACLACRSCEAVCPTDAITIGGEYLVLAGRYKTFVHGVSPPNPLGEPVPEAYANIEDKLTEVEKVIYTRRSNRLFKDKPVPKKLLARILEAGRFAPSAGNCQPWKFVVVTDRSLLREIERKCMKILNFLRWLYLGKSVWRKAAVTLLSYLMINKLDQRPVTAIEKARHLDDAFFWEAPAVIFFLKDVRGISNPDFDSGICAQNMVLAAHSLGLGTCYVGLPVTPLDHLPGLRKRLGIEYPWRPVTTIAVGYPEGKIDRPVGRGMVPVEWIGGE